MVQTIKVENISTEEIDNLPKDTILIIDNRSIIDSVKIQTHEIKITVSEFSAWWRSVLFVNIDRAINWANEIKQREKSGQSNFFD